MLKEVSFIRPILVFLLIAYHSFLVYGGGWSQPDSFIEIPIYKDIASWAYSFLLEGYVFISGYIFYFNIQRRGLDSFSSLLTKKAKRLLLPAWFFGILYHFIINDKSMSFMDSFFYILSGEGHLWFLPMLFWIFILGWILEKLKLPLWSCLIISLLMVLGKHIPFPLRIDRSCGYFIYFLLGKIILQLRHTNLFKDTNVSWYSVLLSLAVFVGLYKSLITIDLGGGNLNKIINDYTHLLYASSGVLFLFLLSMWYVNNHKLSEFYIRLGKACFGMYIFQQFILKFLYFHTEIPSIVGPYCLPWLGLFVTILLSYCLTILVQRIPFIRNLV